MPQDDRFALEDLVKRIGKIVGVTARGFRAKEAQLQFRFLRTPADRQGKPEPHVGGSEIERVPIGAAELSRAFDVQLNSLRPKGIISPVAQEADLTSHRREPRPAPVIIREELDPRAGLLGTGEVGMVDQTVWKQLQSPDFRRSCVCTKGIEIVIAKRERFLAVRVRRQ